ncbi:MAG: HEAT repeat domain-containing protein, partial [Planctomycetes bacterium]|nr:HEAT repeat domain-containing protein [Planctomycetota bacterium]
TAPVFGRVAAAAAKLVESSEKTSAAALLELTTLVTAILYTQGETGIDGELTPLETVELSRPETRMSARLMKRLQEALSTTGSGRLEIVRDGYEQGAFGDLRLIAPALAGLDDTYSEIADFVAGKILPLYGPAILRELQATFDPRGRGGHVRRLTLMHQLDPEAARVYVRRALEDGSREVRIAAIGCLGDSPDDLAFLLEQAGAKAKDVRAAALRALGGSDSTDAVKVLCSSIDGDDLALAVEPLRASRNAAVSAALLAAAERQFDGILSAKDRDQSKLGKQNERLRLLLECLRGRDDRLTEKLLLAMFGRAERLAAVRGEPSGKDVLERLVSIMAAGPEGARSVLIDAHQSLPPASLGEAFVAACRSRKPAEVFKLFSPYLAAKVKEKAKHRDPAYGKREAIAELLVRGAGWWHYERDESDQYDFDLRAALDPKWLDLAVKLGRLDLVQALAVPGHAKAGALLAKSFRQGLKSREDYELIGLVSTMIRVGHPDATDAAIELIRGGAKSKHSYSYYWLGRLIPRLPRDEALPKARSAVADAARTGRRPASRLRHRAEGFQVTAAA